MHVGYRAVPLTDEVQGARLPVHLFYPTRAVARPERFGPFTLEVATDAPLEAETPRALVVISHGSRGSPLVHRDLAVHLAHAGFVVALPEHPGDGRSDVSHYGTPQNLENRPRHLRIVLDALFSDAAVGARLASGVAVVGHSMGGYTALALAGGQPVALPHETADQAFHPVPLTADPRVAALVLLAPAVIWFGREGALAGVLAPILMRTGEKDDLVPAFQTDIVPRGVADPTRVDHRVIPGAGHFSFMSPFPHSMTSPIFPPSQDPEGFDRAAFLPVLHAEIVAFLSRVLGMLD